MGQPRRSIVLIELSELSEIPGKTSPIFPLLGGLYHEQGTPSHWIRFGIGGDEPSPTAGGGVTLCSADFERLCQAARDYEATEILVSEPLAASQTEKLARHSPETVLRNVTDPAALGELTALDSVLIEPRYEWDPGNAPAAAKQMDVIHLTVQPPVGAVRTTGEWLARQVAGIRRSRKHPHGYPRAVALGEIQSADQVAACIAALCQHQLEGHTELWLALRAAQTPEVVETIREHFASSSDSGLRIVATVCASGGSPPNELAPGASAATVLEELRCINELRQLAHEHRGRFGYRGLDLGLDRGLLSHLRLQKWEIAHPAPEPAGVDGEPARASQPAARELGDANPSTHRFGDRRVGLAELVQRLTPLVTQGLKPVLAVEGVTRAELRGATEAALAQAGTVHRLLEVRSDAGPTERVLLVASEEDVLHQASAALRGLAAGTGEAAHRDAARRLGLLFGYPECCVRKYSALALEGDLSLPWSAFARRAKNAGRIPPSLRPLLVPALTFVPCSADCANAATQYASWFDHLGEDVTGHADPDIAEWFAFDGCEHVSLRVVRRDEGSLRYDPHSAAQATGPTSDWLRAGDRLRFLHGQVQVRSGDALLGTHTATHGVWDPARCWNAAEWQELCRGVVTRQLAAALPPTQIDWSLDGSPVAKPEDESSRPDHSRFCRHVEAALAGAVDSLHVRTGYTVRSVTSQQSGVRVLLTDGANRLELWLEPARSAARAFRRGQWVAITHSPGSPVDTKEKRAVVAQLLALLETMR